VPMGQRFLRLSFLKERIFQQNGLYQQSLRRAGVGLVQEKVGQAIYMVYIGSVAALSPLPEKKQMDDTEC
jgi:hypothetical protein